jgi:hypothetical protein
MTHLLGLNPADTYPVSGPLPVALGTISEDHSGRKWMFVRTGASSNPANAGEAVAIDENNSVQLLTKALADQGNKIGFAQSAVPINTAFWALIQGAGTLRVLASCAADARLFTSGTAGALDDTATSQTEIVGARINTTAGGAPTSTAGVLTVEPAIGAVG